VAAGHNSLPQQCPSNFQPKKGKDTPQKKEKIKFPFRSGGV